MATLIESLTAIAVFAVGSSASAAWLARSTDEVADAGAHRVALGVAVDMAARVRANAHAARAGDYGWPVAAAVGRAEADCRRRCMPDRLARLDLRQFRDNLDLALGRAAQGEVRCAEGECVISIQWASGALAWRTSLPALSAAPSPTPPATPSAGAAP
ncbi:hypothetical protein KPL74_07415 [Bacillus sp. NP157]|nr:hypothetical protein KPL74_07415 [Bacillus sp. NP157]